MRARPQWSNSVVPLSPLWVAALFVVAALAIPGPARAVVALPMALLAPGWYSLPAALSTDHTDPIRRVAMSLVLGFAIDTLIAVVLGTTPLGLTRTTMSLAVGAWTLAAGGLRTPDRRPAAAWIHRLRRVALKLTPHAVVAGCAALCMVGAVIALGARENSGRATPARFTVLSLAGPSADLSGPVTVPAGEPFSLNVALRNQTGRPTNYLLRAFVAPRGSAGPALASRNVVVGERQAWSGSLSVALPGGSCLQRLSISAYPAGSSKAVATIGVWLRRAGCKGTAP